METHSPQDLARETASIRWHHRIELPGGVTTPGEIDCRAKLERMRLPRSLEGKTVLDIGAWDGFFSFEAERRGATRVLAVDTWEVRGEDTKTGFDLARRALRSEVEDLRADLFDLSPGEVGEFDVVLFLGVLYHLRHPLLGSRSCAP